MKLWLVIVHIICVGCSVWATNNYQNIQDNEFAEFEDFDSDEESITKSSDSQEAGEKPPNQQEYPSDIFISDSDDDQEMVIEDDSEFEHFQDAEEFEGYGDVKEDSKTESEPKITITKVPIHFRANWDSYWLEILMIMGLLVYFLNFLTGKSKNTKIAHAWYEAHKSLLESNFSLVGDDGALERQETNAGLIKESENAFTLWCSGRTCCDGMLVELRLLKRQDLVAVLAAMLRPTTTDQLLFRVTMGAEDMAPFVLFVGNKKAAAHASKNMADLGVFCGERRPGERYNLPEGFQVMSESGEAAAAVLDRSVATAFVRHGHLIDYVHISDQYSGVRQQQDDNAGGNGGAPKPPDVQRVCLFAFQLPARSGNDAAISTAIESTTPLLKLVLYIIERVRHYAPSREAAVKAAKNRQRVEEAFLKSTHVARAEAAASRREERRRQEKERVLAEEDPEKQRRWEERENKRQAKKRAPKMKQLKVKAL